MLDQKKEDTVRPERRRDEKKIGQRELKKTNQHSYMSSWWAKDDTSDPNEGRDEEPEKYNNKKTKQKVTNKTKPNSWRPSYCWALSDAAH